MGLPGAALFLLVRSARNRLVRQARRLREPRYVASTAFGLLYLWVVVRRQLSGAAPTLALSARPLAELALCALALVLAAGAWVLGGDEGAVAFTEAEVQFFFPAPVTRRGLLHYKLLRTLLAAVLGSAIMALFFSARLSSRPLFFFAGAWLCTGTLALHLTAASLARASLVEHGVAGLRRRALTLAVVLAAFAAVALGALHAAGPLPEPFSMYALARWAEAALRSRALAWPLAPVLAPVHVLLARDGREFVAALPGAALVMALHYAWALSSGVAFEQASAEAAERRARRATAARGQRGVILRRGRPPFRLAARGAPWVALFWKNLIASTRLVQLRLILALVMLAVVGGIVAASVLPGGAAGRLGAIGAVCASLAAYLALLGPQGFDMDLRLDLAQADLLRSLPLRGRDVVTGTMLAPVAVLAVAECALVLAAAALSLGLPIPDVSAGERFAVAAALCILLPALTACGFAVQNAGALLFPSWAAADRQGARGIEAFGQRLVLLAGRLVVLVFGVAPASVPAAAVAELLKPSLGWYAAPIAAACGGAVIVAEVYVALEWLGRAFERADLSH